MLVGIRKLVKRQKLKKAVVKIVFFISIFIIAYLHTKNEIEFRDNYYSLLEDGKESIVWGQIYKKELKTFGYAYYLTDCYVSLSNENIPCNNVMIYVNNDDYSIGSTIKVSGKVSKFNQASNEGQFDLESFYHSQKIDFSVKAEYIECLNYNNKSIRQKLFDVKNYLTNSTIFASGEKDGGILSAMLWGNKSLMDGEIKELYSDSGISHILAISGLHVSMIGMGLYMFLRKHRFSFLSAGIIAGVIVVCYGIMSGGAVSTQRACGMFIISVFAAFIGRSYDLLSALSFLIMVILWQNVFAIFYSGFIFSVVAILGIGLTVKVLCDKDDEKEHKIKESFLSGLGIQLTTIPIVAYYYYEIPVYSIFLNMMVLFFLEYLFISGLSGAIVGLKFVYLARIIVIPAKIILSFYELLCEYSIKLPLSKIIVGRPQIYEIVIYYVLLSCLLVLINKKRKKYMLTKSFIFFCMMFIMFYPGKSKPEFDVLDVGQGLGICGDSGDGLNFFIDGGSSSDQKIGENVILPYLKYKGKRKIDYWFVTHTDDDHIIGLLDAFNNGYRIDNLVIYDSKQKDEALENLLQIAIDNDTHIIQMKSGDEIKTSSISITCINQEEKIYEDVNDMCLSLRINYIKENLSIMICGDLSDKVEKQMVIEDKIKPVDVYIVNHHGSKFSSSTEMLEILRPKISIVSCALQNKYGHPAKESIERIEKINSKIYYTMKEGQISVQ